MKQKVWFITGISGGIGKALAAYVLSKGDIVAGTFRKSEQAEQFNHENPQDALGIILDVTDTAGIDTAIKTILEKFGRIDVVVNNAGVGFAGAIEEASAEEIRTVFEANFFGTLTVTQKVLPVMRAQKSGHIIQISSHGGVKAFAGFGIYNASKFAVEGFSEALAQEIAPLGIKLSIMEPGPFRTGFAGNNFLMAKKVMDDYAGTAGVFRDRIKGVDGKQEGDPEKAAAAIYNLTLSETAPLRLPLGKTALLTIGAKVESLKTDLENAREVAEGVVF
ncbi:oxidoreductase [Lacibacter sp. MH-610]|mgnify:CR=1 FL=1|uniref:oxidoreductase n=1 Tax=Lacibacter sp. MH-610 TaxID=3020883 RepID=UPI003892C69E